MRVTPLVRTIVADSVALRSLTPRTPIASSLWTPRSFTTTTPCSIPRPKKVLPADDSDGVELVVKRPRGRPRKIQVEAEGEGEVVVVEKPRRGRVLRAQAKEDEDVEEEVEEKRPRGRRSKIQTEEDEDDVVEVKTRTKETAKETKSVGRKGRLGPSLPTLDEKRALARKLNIKPQEVPIGFPKAPGGRNFADGRPRTKDDPDEPPRKRPSEQYESQGYLGRPKKQGPPLPTKVVTRNGRQVTIKFNPIYPTGFLPEQLKEMRRLFRLQKADEREKRMDLGIFDARGLLAGRANVPESPLTQRAREYLEMDKEEEVETKDWEWTTVKERKKDGDKRSGSPTKPHSEKSLWRKLQLSKVRDVAPTLASILKVEDLEDSKSLDKSVIMNEARCKEIFERFDLSEYEGCTILDFNPGYGIYSKALNDAVKPKKHILLEGETGFIPYLERICTHESFEIVQRDFYTWKTLDDLIAMGKLDIPKVPREEGVNKKLLITGLLHKDRKGNRFMAQILDNIGKEDWIFQYGRVKCLLWITEEMMSRYIPRTFGRRNRAAVLIEALANIRVLAQPPERFTWSEHRFFKRIDFWNMPSHKPNEQDRATGVEYYKELIYFQESNEPAPIQFKLQDYWPQVTWAESTLVDITPIYPMHYLRGDVPDSEPWKFFNHILTSMMMGRQTSVKDALAKMGGGTEMLLETDETLKSMPDLATKHTVYLSVSDIVALAKAYEFWPWRADDPFLGAELRLRKAGMLDEEENKWTNEQ
ncbi:Mitochondrial transcription factor 1 [Orbilia ellipsospora]|uniref:rRNA adenine N(6)-methyltransferase n=1 Tax=Orbilia ellipsospora TaxID=2528407 RepID=A0AAV9XQ09_9PEZI